MSLLEEYAARLAAQYEDPDGFDDLCGSVWSEHGRATVKQATRVIFSYLWPSDLYGLKESDGDWEEMALLVLARKQVPRAELRTELMRHAERLARKVVDSKQFREWAREDGLEPAEGEAE